MAVADMTRAELRKALRGRCMPCGASSPCALEEKCLRTGQPLAAEKPKRARKDPALAPNVPTEHEEQATLFEWAEAMSGRYPELGELFAVPNGARTAMKQAKKLKREGLRRGVEDVLLLVARGGWHGLTIELKRVNGVPSDVSDDQRKWHAIRTKRGYRPAVCFGAEQAKAVLLEYLALPKTKVTK